MIETPTHLLQVSCMGKPCGWTGLVVDDDLNHSDTCVYTQPLDLELQKSSAKLWFHYNSMNSEQAWLGLQMPPCVNFYTPAYPWWVFNHIPQTEAAKELAQHHFAFEPNPLDWLTLAGNHTEGSLSFINPDRPFVPPQVYVEPQTLMSLTSVKAQSLLPHLWARCHSTEQTIHLASTENRQRWPNTLVYTHVHSSAIQLAKHLQNIKVNIDPDNRLHALRWTSTIQFGNQGLIWHRRHDIDSNNLERFGLEKAHTLLQIDPKNASKWLMQRNANHWMSELINTYCPKKSLEHKLLEQLWSWLCEGSLQATVVYRNPQKTTPPNFASSAAKPSLEPFGAKPEVLGMDYLWNPWKQ